MTARLRRTAAMEEEIRRNMDFEPVDDRQITTHTRKHSANAALHFFENAPTPRNSIRIRRSAPEHACTRAAAQGITTNTEPPRSRHAGEGTEKRVIAIIMFIAKCYLETVDRV